MSPESRRNVPSLRVSTLISAAVVVGVVVVTGLLAPNALRRASLPLSEVGGGARPTPEPAIHLHDPSICPVCGVVEAVRPYEIRAVRGMPAADDGPAGADPNLVPRTAWRVTVRMEDGSYRTLSQPKRPAFKTGDRVRIVDGALAPH